ncbi:hypothetical protein VUR80DRAFT_500 [Thermomyces stellatus]
MSKSDDNSLAEILEDLKNDIDVPTFEQILEMDDDEDREFSRALVFEFLYQAKDTFQKIEGSLAEKDLKALSHQGHYLKGSSATLGLIKIRDNCEKIQRYGSKENPDGTPEPDGDLCLTRITDTLKVLRSDFNDVRKAMKKLYNQDIEEDEEEDGDKQDEEEKEEANKGAKDTEKDKTEEKKDVKDDETAAEKTKDTAKPEANKTGTA